MTGTVSDIDACTKRLEVAVPRAEVADEMERAYRRLSGRVKMKGFRKGKIPRRVLERYYGEEVQAEVLNHVISTSYRSLLEDRGMRPVGEPNVTDINMDDDAPELTYKATVEVIPPFELGEYKGLKVKVHRRTVTDEMIHQQIEALRQRAAAFEDVDRESRAGDYVLFDIEGFEGETAVPGTRGENQALMIGGDESEKELSDALTGLRTGEEADVDIDVPEGASPNIAGKSLRFHLHLKEIKEPHPPELDEEFVKSLGRGYTSTEDLREDVAKEMESMEDANARGNGISELLAALLEAHPFDVPPTLVKGEADEQIREYERRLRQENPDVQLSEARIGELREEVKPQAEEQVRRLILVERIREAEEIEASAEEVEAQLRISAARYGMTPEKLRERMMTTGAMASLVSNINYNKTVSWLYDQADVEFDVQDAADHEAHSHDSEEGAGEEQAPDGDSKEDG